MDFVKSIFSRKEDCHIVDWSKLPFHILDKIIYYAIYRSGQFGSNAFGEPRSDEMVQKWMIVARKYNQICSNWSNVLRQSRD